MARIIYSALVDSIRGSINGTTFQRNAYGYSVKAKPNMVNPNTIRQNLRKRTFSNAVQEWRKLSQANRDAWDAYANAFPIPARKNPNAFLNGLNAFQRWHGVQYQSNSTVLANPSGAQGTAVINQIDLIISGGNLFVELDITTTNGPWSAFLYLSRPLSSTQAFVKSWTRYIVAMTPAQWISLNINAAYVAVFGAAPVLGQLIGVQVVMLNTTNGQILFGAPVIETVIP